MPRLGKDHDSPVHCDFQAEKGAWALRRGAGALGCRPMGLLTGPRAAKIAFTALCLVTMFGAWAVLLDHEVTQYPLVAWMITLPLSFVAVFVHELGHAAAAIGFRQRVEAFAVIPFELRFRPLRLTLAGARAASDLGGYVIYAQGDLSRRTVGLIAAAGPAASFALGIAALVAGLLVPLLAADTGGDIQLTAAAGPPDGPGMLPSDAEVARWLADIAQRRALATWSALCHALAVISVGMGLANLIPVRGSDGDTMLRCLSHPWSSRAQQP